MGGGGKGGGVESKLLIGLLKLESVSWERSSLELEVRGRMREKRRN